MKNLEVLIVDDHRTMLKIIRNILNQIGIKKIDEAFDGEQALTKMKLKKYDLIISDWNMEPMTGLQLIEQVRAKAEYAHQNAPFIMVTAESKPENVMEARKAGVDNYIVKPFSADVIMSKIKATLTKRSMIAQ
jgi:two-component system chemotaxis response regulator CheY